MSIELAMISATEATNLSIANQFYFLDHRIRTAASKGYRTVTLEYSDYGYRVESVTQELSKRGFQATIETDIFGEESLCISW